MLAVIVGGVDHHAVELLQVRRQFVPLGGVDEIGTGPGARERVGAVVLERVRPTDGVEFGDAAPADGIELAGLQRRLDIFVGQRNRHDAELRQELAGSREGVSAEALQIGEGVDRTGGAEIAGIPGAGRKPGHIGNVLVGLLPDLLEAAPVPERGDIERVARGEREVGAEHLDVDRRGSGIVVALGSIDGAGLDGAEQFAMRHQLIGRIELDDHFAVGGGVEPVDGVLHHVFGKGRASVGLQAPPDGGLGLDVGRCEGGGADGTGGRETRLLEELTLGDFGVITHLSLLLEAPAARAAFRVGSSFAIVRCRGWAATARSAGRSAAG